MPNHTDYEDISSRTNRVLDQLMGGTSPTPMLSKAEQLKRYRERTAKTDAIHPDIVKIIQEHGYDGLADYLTAMKKMSKGTK